MSIYWIKQSRTVSKEGTTIRYIADENPSIAIESRKRHIPHADRSGTWDHTTYMVMKDGKDIKERYSLADAKEYAEKMFGTEGE